LAKHIKHIRQNIYWSKRIKQHKENQYCVAKVFKHRKEKLYFGAKVLRNIRKISSLVKKRGQPIGKHRFRRKIKTYFKKACQVYFNNIFIRK